MHFLRKGFTIVELAIVITVIGILATISLVVYNGVQDRAEYAKAQTDMQHLNDAIALYRSRTGAYPVATTAVSWQNTVPSNALSAALVPSYLDRMLTTSKSTYTYWYRSSAGGTDYKLLRVISTGLPAAEKADNQRLNTTGTHAGTEENRQSWGYWSAGGASL